MEQLRTRPDADRSVEAVVDGRKRGRATEQCLLRRSLLGNITERAHPLDLALHCVGGCDFSTVRASNPFDDKVTPLHSACAAPQERPSERRSDARGRTD